MDPNSEKVPYEAMVKFMNDQAQYEVKRNVLIAVLLYFGPFSTRWFPNI